jgi:myo-inositol-1(or 4)-monophosphatase
VFAIDLARHGGAHLMSIFSEEAAAKEIRLKGPTDLVTRADHEVEALIARRVRETYPDHGLLAEEGTVLPGREYRWIVDPLDGTTNFAHGVPWFAVSIALEQLGEVILGVVFHPVLDELFVAERGNGTWLSTRGADFIRLNVSTTDDLESALLGTGFWGGEPTVRDVAPARLDHFLESSRGVRNMGSAAIHLAYVAAGRLDGFWEARLNLWDIAAGILLVEEAGGRVTDLEGRLLRSGDILASNAGLHTAILQVILEAR